MNDETTRVAVKIVQCCNQAITNSQIITNPATYEYILDMQIESRNMLVLT